jgi:magnesium-transporting ATPase (P-type)
VSTKTGCCFFLQGGKQNAKKHEKQHLKNVEKHGTGVKQQGHNRKKGIVIKGWNEELSLHAVLSFLLNNKKEKYVIPFCFVLFLFLGNGETILNKKKERALAKSVKHQKTKPKKNKLKEKKEIYSRLPVVLSLQMNSSALFFISLPLSIPSSIHFALLFFRHSHTNTHTHISVSSTRHESSQTNTTRLQQIWLFFFFWCSLLFSFLVFGSLTTNEWWTVSSSPTETTSPPAKKSRFALPTEIHRNAKGVKR